MPKKADKSSGKKKPSRVSSDDDDESVDSKGNIRNLIDYDYSESDEEGERPPRKAALIAKKAMKSIAAKAAKAAEKKRGKPTLVIESEEEEEEEVPRKKKSKKSPKEESEDEEDEEEEKAPKKKKAVAKKSKRKEESEEEEEEDDGETLGSEDTDEDDDDDDDDEDSEEDSDYVARSSRGGIDIVISDLLGGGGGRDPNKPHKYNLKKESPQVRQFVKLVQQEDDGEEDTIDNDITYFKSLTKDRQSSLIRVLEHKASPAEVAVPLKFKILEKVAAKPDLNRIAMAKYNALCSIDPSSTEYYKTSHWINGFTGMPIGIYKDLPVRIEDGPEKCHEFMSTVHKSLETAIYGHDEPKLQIMQFVSSWIANPKAHGNVLSIHGPPGVGKTSLIKDGVAKALGRPFHFISLGGATDASFLDGHSYTYEGSTWGKIVDVLIQSKCMNPVIYFDELDKVSETPKGDEIMNILIHLTDQSQNDRFQDKYFTGIDLDLSRCLFIFSHNNHEKVNPILRDRMYNIAVQGFSVKEKMLIAENYLLPDALKEAGLHEKVSISKDILNHVIETYTGGEAGVRELKRCIQTIISKLNLLRFYNNPKQVPFAIKDFALPFTLKKEHVELFLKRKETVNESIAHLYM